LAARPADKPIRSAGVLLLAVAAAVLPACGSGEQTIDDRSLPYSFAYPSGFQSGGRADVPARETGFDNQTIVAKKNGLDLVAVQTQPLRRAVTPDLMPQFKREVAQNARRLGRLRSRRDVRVGGLEGVMFEMALRGQSGVPVRARWVYTPKDKTLYWINCQWRRDRVGVLSACDKVLRTFRAR
jgi:hypothetical protein